jgi:hypothetical protein
MSAIATLQVALKSRSHDQKQRVFVRLHNQSSARAGIVVCSKNLDWDAYTTQIHRALGCKDNIAGQLLQVAN